MALVGPIDTSLTQGRGSMSQWGGLLSGALDRAALLEAEAAQRESLRQAYERERMLANTVRELGCPVLPLLPGVLGIPLIGAIDSHRAQLLIDTMLAHISDHQATTVIIDLTGVPVVDTQVANSLIQATQAAQLLGARAVLAGVRPEIAQSIVGLGVNLSHIATERSLEAALQSLFQTRQLRR